MTFFHPKTLKGEGRIIKPQPRFTLVRRIRPVVPEGVFDGVSGSR